MVGAELTGSYTYSDADGDPEGASILRWYRSNDAVLDAGDTIVAGEIEVLPSAVKTSTSLNAQRLADNLFNSNGMSVSGGGAFQPRRQPAGRANQCRRCFLGHPQRQ